VDPYELEEARIDDIVSDRTPPVRVNTSVEELWDRILDQNFVPVVDDRDIFVGIVTRRSVLAYLMNKSAEEACS
jgi:CBS domain-containing protein